MAKLKTKPKEPNKKRNMAEEYETAYYLLFNQADKELQARILQAKNDPTYIDRRVENFIHEVIKLAEKE